MNELKGNSSLPAPERESERKKETEKRLTTIFFWVNQLPTPSPPPPFHASLPPRCVTGSPQRWGVRVRARFCVAVSSDDLSTWTICHSSESINLQECTNRGRETSVSSQREPSSWPALRLPQARPTDILGGALPQFTSCLRIIPHVKSLSQFLSHR